MAAWGYLALVLLDKLLASMVAIALFVSGVTFTLRFANNLARKG
jgi:hypothetical protein